MFYLWLICVILTVITANSRGHNGWAALIWGGLFGPVALAAYLLIPRNQEAIDSQLVITGAMRHCSDCRELIRRHASKCRFCGTAQPET